MRGDSCSCIQFGMIQGKYSRRRKGRMGSDYERVPLSSMSSISGIISMCTSRTIERDEREMRGKVRGRLWSSLGSSFFFPRPFSYISGIFFTSFLPSSSSLSLDSYRSPLCLGYRFDETISDLFSGPFPPTRLFLSSRLPPNTQRDSEYYRNFWSTMIFLGMGKGGSMTRPYSRVDIMTHLLHRNLIHSTR